MTSGSIDCVRSGTLANGASANTLTVPAVANITGTITAAFGVAGTKVDGTEMPDGDSSNNTATADVDVTSGSDVSITKSPNGTVVEQGSTVSYTLQPRLNGGQLLIGQPITVTDTLGAGLTLVSAGGDGWTCDSTIECTRPGYDGGNFSNMPAITVVATATQLGALSNSAGIQTALTDPDNTNNTALTTITSSNGSDLRLLKSASHNPVASGVPYVYTLQVRNLGPLALPAGQPYEVRDVVPVGVTLQSGGLNAPGWTCDPLPFVGDGTTSWGCSRSTALAVNADAPAIQVTAVSSSGSTTNAACVALDAGLRVDEVAGNNCAGVTVLSTTEHADLRVTSKTATPQTVLAGQDLTYVITVDNQGPNPAGSVIVEDTLSSLVNIGGLQSISASQGSCTPAGPYPLNGTSHSLSCNLGTLAVGGSATVTVVVRPSIAVSGTRRNTATVRSLEVGDPVTSNNSFFVDSTVTAVVDLVAGKIASPVSARAGTPVTYVASVTNQGPSAAQDVQLTDTLPANAAFIGLQAVSNGGSCAPITAGTVGGTLSCSWPAQVNAGAQRTVTYRLRPLSSAVGGALVNTVAVSTSTVESNLTNNSATTNTPVTEPQLDILINKVDSADPVNLGQSTTYTITVNNSGPSYGTNVVMTDVFPAPGSTPTATFSYQGSLTVDADGSCVEPEAGATTGTLTCTFPGLASGQTATITYVMRAEALTVTGALTGTAFNRADVQVDETETTLANNVVTHDTTARRTAVATDMQITKSGPAGPLAPGAEAVYTLVVTNNGPLASDGAQVVDVLPSGLLFVSAADCVHVSGTVSCNVGPLAVGSSRTFTVTTRIANPFTGSSPLNNTAIVDAPGGYQPGQQLVHDRHQRACRAGEHPDAVPMGAGAAVGAAGAGGGAVWQAGGSPVAVGSTRRDRGVPGLGLPR